MLQQSCKSLILYKFNTVLGSLGRGTARLQHALVGEYPMTLLMLGVHISFIAFHLVGVEFLSTKK